MTPVELRAGIDQLITRAEMAERALAVAQRGLDEANAKVQHYAAEAAVLTVRLENARDIERRAVVSLLRSQAEKWEPNGSGTAALTHAVMMLEKNLHRRGER